MSSLKPDYEIIAIGNIRLRWIPNLPTKKQYLDVQNRGIIEEIWQKTWEESGRKLFNGTLLNFLGLNERE
ncbi:hypothetical protein LR013_04170 [candidate division NPL-UPA2 bacterium]|nr:hypothetical protein [candidate division NPL-UPA2 bacterium]